MNGEPTASFGRRCGVKEATLRNILLGAMPRADNLFAIADAAGVTVEWLATGKWPVYRSDLNRALDVASNIEPRPSAALDMPRFQLAIEAVEEGLEASNRTMTPPKKAELFLAVYDMMEEPTITKERVLKLVKLAA